MRQGAGGGTGSRQDPGRVGSGFMFRTPGVMAHPLVPSALLDPVVAYFRPRRVILFGSAARGEAGADSDLDLLVVVDDDTPAEMLTLAAGLAARRPYPEPADVIPVREEIFRRKAKIPGTLSRAATLDGVVVYERP